MLKKSNWEIMEDHLFKSFIFKDFREAMAAMVAISYIAEELDHHPEWFNVYNRLDIRLTTHETGGISDKDHELAGRIDALNLIRE
jgi:4a-hydroxytetrahydrobiopterin dehydratase